MNVCLIDCWRQGLTASMLRCPSWYVTHPPTVKPVQVILLTRMSSTNNLMIWCQTSPDMIHIVTGDMNAQVGNDVRTWKPILGKHAERPLNENGARLLTFCLAQDLLVASSLFAHRKIHKLTWNSPDGITVNQIDYTLINRSGETSGKISECSQGLM